MSSQPFTALDFLFLLVGNEDVATSHIEYPTKFPFALLLHFFNTRSRTDQRVELAGLRPVIIFIILIYTLKALMLAMWEIVHNTLKITNIGRS